MKALVLGLILLASLPSAKEFLASDDRGLAFCSGQVSGQGTMEVYRLINANGFFALFKAMESDAFVLAVWKDIERPPVDIYVGTVKGNTLVVISRHSYNEMLDSHGPCPFVYPRGA